MVLCILWWMSVHGAGDWRSRLWHGHHYHGWPTYDDANTILEEWLQEYPNLFRKETFGKSFQDRDMMVYVMTDKQSTHQKDQVLLTALLHAREPAGLDALLYYVGSILENTTRSDPQAIYTVQRKEIWAVPFMNPDAYIANEKTKNHMIRKNMRRTCMAHAHRGGVDLNRNFGFHYEKKFTGCDEEYQGTKAFSEPETQAIKELVERNHFKVAYNYHSYGEMLTHPFNYVKGAITNEMPADHQAIYAEIGMVFKYKVFGTAYQTVGYSAHGESDDWFYGVHNIISLSPELGPEAEEFWPHQQYIDGIDVRSFPRTSYMVYKAGCEPDVSWELDSKAKLTCKVKNAGVSPCPPQRLAFAASLAAKNPVIIDVPVIANRTTVSISGLNAPRSNYAFCLQEVGMSSCVCDTRGPGTGTWASKDIVLCEILLARDASQVEPKEATPAPSPKPVETEPSSKSATPAPSVKPVETASAIEPDARSPKPVDSMPTFKPKVPERDGRERDFELFVLPPPDVVFSLLLFVIVTLLCCVVQRGILHLRSSEFIDLDREVDVESEIFSSDV
eukprot:GEMP01011368.1.p1 GENE.GEMP01011368.1~~GEMP01011368.1.p1  ORF type:complete len:560 (+),score=83.82 GEMP01011368.1:34-1713(+)